MKSIDRVEWTSPLKAFLCFVVLSFFHAADVDGGDAESGLRAALFLRPRSQALH